MLDPPQVSMANLSGNLTGLSIIFGLLSALDTLGPQAAGKGAKAELGVLATRGYLISITAMVPALLIWWRMEQLLLMVGQPPAVAQLAARFLKVYCLAVPALLFTEVVRRFLQVQDIVLPFVWITAVVAMAVHPALLQLYYTAGLGFDGVAAAVVTTFWIYTALTVAHVLFNRPPVGRWSGTWRLLFDGVHDPASLSRVGDLTRALPKDRVIEFLWLGAPGVLGMSEWWLWEVIAFMAGQFGVVPLAAHAVAYNLIPLSGSELSLVPLILCVSVQHSSVTPFP